MSAQPIRSPRIKATMRVARLLLYQFICLNQPKLHRSRSLMPTVTMRWGTTHRLYTRLGPLGSTWKCSLALSESRTSRVSTATRRSPCSEREPRATVMGTTGYATSNNHARLIEVVENYSLCATHTSTDSYPLVTEGLSIRYGGHYDINRNFAGSHRNHRAGEDVDIGFSALSQAERNCLYLAYQDIYTTPVPGESLVLDEDGNAVPVEATHVHLWSGATHKYPRDQTQTFQQALLNYYCDVLGFCP